MHAHAVPLEPVSFGPLSSAAGARKERPRAMAIARAVGRSGQQLVRRVRGKADLGNRSQKVAVRLGKKHETVGIQILDPSN